MPQDRHIFLPDLTSSILPDLYIHELDCENYGGAMGTSGVQSSQKPTLLGGKRNLGRSSFGTEPRPTSPDFG